MNTDGNEAFRQLLEDELHASASAELRRAVDTKWAEQGARLVEQALRQFETSADGIIIAEEKIHDIWSAAIVSTDRPFITTTVHTLVTSLCGEPKLFVHPILPTRFGQLSLVFLQLEGAADADVAEVRRAIPERLVLLEKITDDYDLTVRSVNSLRSELPEEIGSFLSWLLEEGLVVLGYAHWRRPGEDAAEQRGLFSRSAESVPDPSGWRAMYESTLMHQLREDFENNRALPGNMPMLCISSVPSPVHRGKRIVHVLLRGSDTEPDAGGCYSLLGTFTSRGRTRENSRLPLLRGRFEQLADHAELVRQSHNYKLVRAVFDGMPKPLLFNLSLDALEELMQPYLGLEGRTATRVSVHSSAGLRGVYAVVSLESRRLTPEVELLIQRTLSAQAGVPEEALETVLDVAGKSPSRLFFYIPGGDPARLHAENLRSIIEQHARTWEEKLRAALANAHTPLLAEKYESSFSEEYRSHTAIDEAVHDVVLLERLSAAEVMKVGLRFPTASESRYMLTVMRVGAFLTVSEAVPILENLGFEVLSEEAVAATHPDLGEAFIHRFAVRPRERGFLDGQLFDDILGPALERLFMRLEESDLLNSLMLSERVPLKGVRLLRTYCLLLWQIQADATRATIVRAVAQSGEASRLLWEFFVTRFDPGLPLSREGRDSRCAELSDRFFQCLRTIENITFDRVLRSLHQLMRATVRTSFFLDQRFISLKIDSQQVAIMPQPRPVFETFVYSPIVEGVHLRSGRVARGGIRWSNRPDDYRSEVLGLMKTQRTKNALIVPTGAKGGFVLRGADSPQDLPERVREAYKEFIRAIIILADSKDGQGIRPRDARLVVYDDVDPYLVVAADKGTATFSDTANEIAEREFSFWLGDAFASGGSNGYDHKKLGITARGVWECVKWHLKNAGINPEQQDFSVIGIGDMSGDVFGNGLLLSPRMRLLAAFDHRHIFLDPNPDVAAAFAERVRLFQLPRSSWKDYSTAIISKGGGVYDRFAKEIRITPEIRRLLDLPDGTPDEMDGETLIRHVLRAPCDLLWNGGIGTYVKSSEETNAEVYDGSNDRVRVDASQVRARVVGEGGNLGFTQRARIELARAGGLLNTDAIDNAAGVHLSDREVNIKLLLNPLVASGRLAPEARNSLLAEVSGDVVVAVLKANRRQGIALALSARRSIKKAEYFRRLIVYLSKYGFVSRVLDVLPDDEEFNELVQRQRGLERPIIAPVMAGVKLWCQEALVNSKLVEDPVLEGFLLEYFPATLQERYGADILGHPLRANIIAAQVSNRVIDAVGVTFIHRMCSEHGATAPQVIKCILAAECILGTEQLRDAIEAAYDRLSADQYYVLLERLLEPLREASAWLLTNHPHSTTLDSLVSQYRDHFLSLTSFFDDMVDDRIRERLAKRRREFKALGMSDSVTQVLATLPNVSVLLEIARTARDTERPLRTVAEVFSALVFEVGLEPVFRLSRKLEPKDKWELELVAYSYDRIRRGISGFAALCMERGVTDAQGVHDVLQGSTALQAVKELLAEFFLEGAKLHALAVIATHVERLAVR